MIDPCGRSRSTAPLEKLARRSGGAKRKPSAHASWASRRSRTASRSRGLWRSMRCAEKGSTSIACVRASTSVIATAPPRSSSTPIAASCVASIAGRPTRRKTLTTWLVALHMANVFGLPYRILVVVLGLGIVALSVTGVYIWWSKRAARRVPARRSRRGDGRSAPRVLAGAARRARRRRREPLARHAAYRRGVRPALQNSGLLDGLRHNGALPHRRVHLVEEAFGARCKRTSRPSRRDPSSLAMNS